MDSTEYPTSPKKSAPVGGEVIDDVPGWVHAINVQGVIFMSHDHYVVWHDQPTAGDVSVVCWDDDPVDWPGLYHAEWWVFQDPAMDLTLNPPQMNTRQWNQLYGEQAWLKGLPSGLLKTTGGEVTKENWNKFTQRFDPGFDGPLAKHGIWVDDALNDLHAAARSAHGWEEWIL